MKKNRSSVSKARSHKEMGEFWDTHDASEILEKGKDVKFKSDVESEVNQKLNDQLSQSRKENPRSS